MHSWQIKHMGLAFELDGNINKYLSVQTGLNRQFSLSVLCLRVEKDLDHRLGQSGVGSGPHLACGPLIE